MDEVLGEVVLSLNLELNLIELLPSAFLRTEPKLQGHFHWSLYFKIRRRSSKAMYILAPMCHV